MAISKWGKRVEEAMNAEPAPPPTLSEQISAAALDTEIQETCRLIGEWMVQRARVFTGSEVEVSYDVPMDWYEITISYATRGPDGTHHKAATHRAFAQIRSEDIAANTTGARKWANYLDSVWKRLRTTISNSLRASGHTEIPGVIRTDSAGWYEAGKGSRVPRSSGTQVVALPWTKPGHGVLLTWGHPAPISADDEAAAIESIKEAMKHEGTD